MAASFAPGELMFWAQAPIHYRNPVCFFESPLNSSHEASSPHPETITGHPAGGGLLPERGRGGEAGLQGSPAAQGAVQDAKRVLRRVEELVSRLLPPLHKKEQVTYQPRGESLQRQLRERARMAELSVPAGSLSATRAELNRRRKHCSVLSHVGGVVIARLAYRRCQIAPVLRDICDIPNGSLTDGRPVCSGAAVDLADIRAVAATGLRDP